MKPGDASVRQERTPLGIALAVGTAALVPVLFLDALVPATEPRLVLPALAVLAFGAATADLAATGAFLVVTALLVDGFLLGGRGTLTWDGAADVAGLTVLVAAALVGTAAGSLGRRLQGR